MRTRERHAAVSDMLAAYGDTLEAIVEAYDIVNSTVDAVVDLFWNGVDM